MIKSHCLSTIIRLLKQFPVVLLNGARQCGKSTLAKQLIDSKVIANYITLDDSSALSLAQHDPDNFLEQFDSSLVIDEVQRVPDLMRALKKNVDNNRQPGRFFLTGSANVLSYPGVTESLAGRMAIVSLEGLSLREFERKLTPSSFIDDIFSGATVSTLLHKWKKPIKGKNIGKKYLCDRMFFGGYPELSLKRNPDFLSAWFSAYNQAYVERDVRDLSKVFNSFAFSKLFHAAGLQTGNLLNMNNLANNIGIDQRSAARYIHIFSLTYQTILLHPWFSNLRKRVIKTPKIFTKDSGLACFLAGLTEPKDLLLYQNAGAIFETWLYAELRKLCNDNKTKIYFYRTHAGKEVDFILNRAQQYVGIEAKFKSQVTAKDFSGLQAWRKDLKGEALGLVLYCGEEVWSFGDNLIAVPIGCLA